MSLTFTDHLAAHRALFERLETLGPDLQRAAALCAAALARGGKLLFCGNGGSAADSQHLASEFVGRFVNDRRALAAIALSTDSSALTAVGNDYGFAQVFERPLRALGREGDVLIGISTSGRSPNVEHAMQAARELGLATIGLLGRDGGTIAALCDVPLVVPDTTTARIQEAHIFLGHVLCAEVETLLKL